MIEQNPPNARSLLYYIKNRDSEKGLFVHLEYSGEEQDFENQYNEISKIARRYGAAKSLAGRVIREFEDLGEHVFMVFYFPDNIRGRLERFCLDQRVGRFLDRIRNKKVVRYVNYN